MWAKAHRTEAGGEQENYYRPIDAFQQYQHYLLADGIRLQCST